tara:strand:- start:5354 stop:5836 length:483 start_codon:yes stop_codon:yes gene_type:complete
MLNSSNKFFDGKWVRAFIVLTYSYFCLIILIEVIRRYAFGDSSAWGEMTARYAFVYMTYAAAAEGIRQKKHIRVDLIDKIVKPKSLNLLNIYYDTLVTIVAILVIYYSLKLINVQLTFGIVMTAADINMAFAQAALPLGWALMLIRITQNWLDSRNLNKP